MPASVDSQSMKEHHHHGDHDDHDNQETTRRPRRLARRPPSHRVLTRFRITSTMLPSSTDGFRSTPDNIQECSTAPVRPSSSPRIMNLASRPPPSLPRSAARVKNGCGCKACTGATSHVPGNVLSRRVCLPHPHPRDSRYTQHSNHPLTLLGQQILNFRP